MNNTKR